MIEKCFLLSLYFALCRSRLVASIIFFDWLVLHPVWCFAALISTAQEKKTTPSCQWKRLKCIWNVGFGRKRLTIRYTTKRLVFLLLDWMDSCGFGDGYTNALRIAVATTFFTTLYRVNFSVEEERVAFPWEVGFLLFWDSRGEHMGMIMS